MRRRNAPSSKWPTPWPPYSSSVAASVELVDINGVSLFTRTLGSGPDVVVLHGGPGAHHDYLLPQYDALASGRRLRYYDQRGGGQSQVDRTIPVGWTQQVRDLHELLDHWSIERAVILGYSWGGLLSLLFAVQNPDRVDRLALVSPASTNAAGRSAFNQRFAERQQRPEIVKSRQELNASDLKDRDPDAYWQRAFELSVAGYFKDFERVPEMTPFRVTFRTQEEVWQSLGDYDLRDDLEKVTAPTLVMHGTHDPIPIETARETATMLNADFVEFDDSGHVPHVEESEKFVATLDHFLPST